MPWSQRLVFSSHEEQRNANTSTRAYRNAIRNNNRKVAQAWAVIQNQPAGSPSYSTKQHIYTPPPAGTNWGNRKSPPKKPQTKSGKAQKSEKTLRWCEVAHDFIPWECLSCLRITTNGISSIAVAAQPSFLGITKPNTSKYTFLPNRKLLPPLRSAGDDMDTAPTPLVKLPTDIIALQESVATTKAVTANSLSQDALDKIASIMGVITHHQFILSSPNLPESSAEIIDAEITKSQKEVTGWMAPNLPRWSKTRSMEPTLDQQDLQTTANLSGDLNRGVHCQVENRQRTQINKQDMIANLATRQQKEHQDILVAQAAQHESGESELEAEVNKHATAIRN